MRHDASWRWPLAADGVTEPVASAVGHSAAGVFRANTGTRSVLALNPGPAALEVVAAPGEGSGWVTA